MRRRWMTGLLLWAVLAGWGVGAAVQFTGTVTGPDGAVAGVTVDLYRLSVDVGSMSYTIHPAGQTETGADGQFAITADTEQPQGYQIHCILAQKEGLSCGWATLIDVNQTVADITLTEPQKIIGFVENPDHTPAADAEVRLVVVALPGEGEQFMFGIDPIDIFAAKTCEDGRFEFNNLPESASAEFMVKKPGKGTLTTLNQSISPSQGLTYKAGQTDIILTLQDGLTLAGRVITQEDQQPVAGVAVTAMDVSLPINLTNEPLETGADGAFAFHDLAPGDYRVSIQSSDWIAEPLTVSMTDADVDDADIELTKGGLLQVKVVDSATAEPVQGAAVLMRLTDTNIHQQVMTDAAGVAEKQVLPGTYQIGVYAQAYRSSGEAALTVVEHNKTATVTVELGGQSKIAGRVVGPDGDPVEGAVIETVPNSGGRPGGIASDADGRFTLAWDPGQLSWSDGEMYLSAVCRDDNLVCILPIETDTQEATLTLQKGIEIQGRIVTSAGEPIADADVVLHFRGSGFSSSYGPPVKTDAAGHYTFTALAPEHRYMVRVNQAPGYGTGQQDVTMAGDTSKIDLANIVLNPADLKLSGMVVDADDQPVANVRLYCYGDGQPNLNGTTDAEGKFAFDNVCAGPIRVNANQQVNGEYLHGNVQTEGGAEDVTLILTAQGTSQYVPRTPPSLVGQPLPELADSGLPLKADAGVVLLFAWDMNQRPSRHFVKQLAAKSDLLADKGVTVILLNAAAVPKENLDAWLADNGIAWPCGVLTENVDDAKFKMGIRGLPWLILSDARHTVIAEGFTVDELDQKLP